MTDIDPAIVDNPHVREVLEGAYRDAGAGGLLRVRLHARVDTALAGLIVAAVDAARAEGDKQGAARVRAAVEGVPDWLMQNGMDPQEVGFVRANLRAALTAAEAAPHDPSEMEDE